MATSFKLPSIRVRRGCTKGRVTFKSISRGSTRLKRSRPYAVSTEAKKLELSIKETENDLMYSDTDVCCDDGIDDWEPVNETVFEGMPCVDKTLPSLYSVKQKAASNAWRVVRERLRNVCVEGASMPDDQLCISCACAEATMWCMRCGALAYFCNECWKRCHAKVNIFHTPQIWEVRI